MPAIAKELSPLEIKRISEPGSYAVGGVQGLTLKVTPTGGKTWVLRVRIKGERTELGGIGAFPDVSVGQARDKAREIKNQIDQGNDPRAERKAVQNADKQSFRAIAADYITAHRAGWKNAKHADQWANTLATYAFPVIGSKHVRDVTTEDVLAVLTPIWNAKNETASRVRNRIEMVLSYAMALGHRERGLNPAAWRGCVDQLLPKQSKVAPVTHHEAVDYRHVHDFKKLLANMEGIGARCLEFVLLTACRSGEARLATWAEFDLNEKVWSLPAERMKSGRPHRVPLSMPVLALLDAMPRLAGEELMFPGLKKGKPLSDMTLTACMRRMGLDAVPHGLRSTFRDWAAETTSTPNEVVEMALAHVVGDATEAAYRRGDLFDKRRVLMDQWATYLTQVASATVVPLRKRA